MVTTWKNQLAAFILHLWKSCEVFMLYHQILYFSIIKLEVQRIQILFFFFFFLENIYWPTVYLGEGNGNPLQYSCLENPMDRGARWATVHGVTKSRTRLSNFTYLLAYCVSVSGSLGIVELNKIHALRKLEICEWATQANSMIFWNSHSHSCLNYNSGESKLFQITQIVASLLHFTVPVDSTTLKHPLGPHVNIPLKNN